MNDVDEKALRDDIVAVLTRGDLENWQKCSEIDRLATRKGVRTAEDIRNAMVLVSGLLGGWRNALMVAKLWKNKEAILASLERLSMTKFSGLFRAIDAALGESGVEASNIRQMERLAEKAYPGLPSDQPIPRTRIEEAIDAAGLEDHGPIMDEVIASFRRVVGING